MAAMDFPSSPTEGQTYTAASGAQYVFQSPAWMQVSAAQIKLGASEPNILINGAMQVSQQHPFGTTLSISGQYPADMWSEGHAVNAGSVAFVANVIAAADVLPAGEPRPLYSIRLSNGVATPSPAATNSYYVRQGIERANLRRLNWFGTAGPRHPAVLRFLAKVQNLTAPISFSVSLQDRDSGGISTVSFTKLFTVDTADSSVWKLYEIPIPAPPVGGNWGGVETDMGATLTFTAMSGTTYVAPLDNAWNAGSFIAAPGQSNFIAQLPSKQLEITNVGLYADPQATGKAPPYEIPRHDATLGACQRYYVETQPGGHVVGGYGTAALAIYSSFSFPVVMRAIPTVNITSSSNSNCGGGMSFSQAVQEAWRGYISVAATGSAYSVFSYTASARI